MTLRHAKYCLFVFSLLLSACGSPPEDTAPATVTSLPPTATQTPIPFTDTPHASTPDLAIFGAVGLNEIQAFTLEPVANAIFAQTMDSFIVGGTIRDYLVTRVTIFPGSSGLLAEITYNVRTADPAWLADGGTTAADDWINDKCNRFDFVTTETEHQLKNRRLCN